MSFASYLRRQLEAAAIEAFGADSKSHFDARIALSRRSIAGLLAYEAQNDLHVATIAQEYGHTLNTDPDEYAFKLGPIPSVGAPSRFDRVVELLQRADARILPGRGFHAAVTNAIFDDALRSRYSGSEWDSAAVYARAVRRWGKRSARVRIGRAAIR
jgi:hypothetical protein